MESYIVMIGVTLIAVIAIAIAVIAMVLLYKNKTAEGSNKINKRTIPGDLTVVEGDSLTINPYADFAVKFEDIPALTEVEEASLIEIKDKRILARIDNVVPGALQVVANTGAVFRHQQAVKNAGQLYQAIIPQGAILADSKAMPGAVRGFYHGADGIQGHANLVEVDGNKGDGLATASVVSAVMALVAMVVGQYYMAEINDQICEINNELGRITTFQYTEYQGRVCALVADIQKCSQFQVEYVENEELRNRELNHLKAIEHECTQLLGQANQILKEYENKKGLDYPNYEKLISEAQVWYQYQQILLRVLSKIEELTYTLNFGKISKENCYAMFRTYEKQADEALKALESWHKETVAALEIDLDAGRRRRQGIDGFFMNIPALFNDDLHYRDVSKSTISMITKQSSGQHILSSDEDSNLFQKDVRLIAKDGKLYYLPEVTEKEWQEK